MTARWSMTWSAFWPGLTAYRLWSLVANPLRSQWANLRRRQVWALVRWLLATASSPWLATPHSPQPWRGAWLAGGGTTSWTSGMKPAASLPSLQTLGTCWATFG